MLGVYSAVTESSCDCAPCFEADWKAYMSGIVLRVVAGRSPCRARFARCDLGSTLKDIKICEMIWVKRELTQLASGREGFKVALIFCDVDVQARRVPR